MKTLDDYMTAFNRMDMAAWEATFQFPHYMPRERANESARSRRIAEGRRRPQIALQVQVAESQRAWGRRKIIQWSADKAHVDTLFVRYRADGTVIGSFESLYVLTKEQGRWGVKLRSSFAP